MVALAVIFRRGDRFGGGREHISVSRSNVRVRPATTDDIDSLVCLTQSLDLSTGVFSGKPLQDSSTAHLAKRFGEILANRERVLLIASDDSGVTAGMLAARNDDIGAIDIMHVLLITHLVVAPGYRRRGIGRSLLAAAVHLADEAGIEHMLATAAAGSREGNRYLARIGFAPLVLYRIAPTNVLRRSLGMTDVAGRMAVLRRARLARAHRAGFSSRAVGRGA